MVISIRNIFVATIFLLCITASYAPAAAEAAILQKPPNNLNLKGYWSFNEGTSTIATDFSRNYATGTLTNMENTDWVSGKLGKALDFDGSNEYVDLGMAIPGISGNAAFTMCAWVNTDSVTSDQSIVATGNPSVALNAAALFLNVNGDGSLSMEFGGAKTVASAAGVISAGRWYHVCGTKTAGAINTTSTLYINGLSTAISTASADTPSIATTDASIGQFVNSGYYFDGKIDEVRVYNTALTAAQILSLYRSGAVTLAASQKNPVTSSLISHWSFDGRDVVNGVFLDTGNGTHPAYLGPGMATATAYAPGRVGQGLKFDGVDDYARVPNSADFDFGSNNFTIAWWEYRTSNDNGLASISRSSTGATYVPFMVGYSNAGADLLVYMSSDLASWDIASGEVLGPVTLNQWAHYAVKRSGTTFTTYKNGTQISTWESASALAAAGGTDPQYDLTLGGYYLDTYFFRGTLDDVRIYNRAITSTELSQIYAAGVGATAKVNLPKNTFMANGLVGLWSFDGQDMVAGTTAYDRSGSGYDGTLVSIAATDVRPGKVGQALYFDGTNSEITIPNLDAYGTRSVSFWMKRGRAPANWFDGIIGCSSTGGWGIGIYDYNGVGSKIYDGKIGVTDYRSTAGITDQEWHHIVETRGGGTIKFYIDGVLDSSQADSDTYDCGVATYQIGNINSTSPKFQGLIDDLRLYNRVLTAAEVSALYNRTK